MGIIMNGLGLLIEGQHIPIPFKGVKKIEEQMENCICKIKKNGKKGTGFICKISHRFYALITNNHILNYFILTKNSP